MRILILLLLFYNLFFAQTIIYTDLETSNKNIKNNQVIKICKDIFKELQKRVGISKKNSIYPLNQKNKIRENKKDTIVYPLSPTEDIHTTYQSVGSILYNNFTLYGNQNYIYYIDTVEDVQATSRIYTKKIINISKNIFSLMVLIPYNINTKQKMASKKYLKHVIPYGLIQIGITR